MDLDCTAVARTCEHGTAPFARSDSVRIAQLYGNLRSIPFADARPLKQGRLDVVDDALTRSEQGQGSPACKPQQTLPYCRGAPGALQNNNEGEYQ